MNKSRILILLSLFSIGIALQSCNNEPIDKNLNIKDFNPNPDDPSNPTSYFKVDFNNQTWTAQTATVYISGNTIKLEATKGNQEEGFGFILDGSTVGTYLANENLVGYSPANADYAYTGFNFAVPTENTGSVIITSIDATNHTISGTFSYKGYWSNTTVTNVPPIHFTNGVFKDLPYTTTNPTNDTFYAKVDGQEFVDTDITVGVVNNFIGFTARNANFDDVSISMADTLDVGTYSIENIPTSKIHAIYHLSNVSYYGTSGTLSILVKTPTRVKGTFAFTATAGTTAHPVTQGEFDIEY